VKEVKALHRQAMERADFALDARRKGDSEKALLFFHEAFELESKAAYMLANAFEAEPTRSVLLRSAASLALDCKLIVEAEKLICTALTGNPPSEISEELRDLLEQVYFQRHLELRGVVLHETEVQMSLSGKSVGFGIAPFEAFVSRVQNTEKLLYRTAERLIKLPFRTAGRISSAILKNVELYATVARPASFAVSFRVGRSTQMTLPGIAPSLGEQTIDDMLECLELFNKQEEEKLKAKIPQEDYYNNFMGLAKSIAPDGEEVNLVGFTAFRQGSTRKVALTFQHEQPFPTVVFNPIGATEVPEDQRTTMVQGFLKEADSRNKERGKIHIIDSEGTSHTIIVPPGMMTDIVKPHWESEVVIVGTKKRNEVYLVEIRPVKGR
jgi:hypothetical protein